VSVTLEAIAHLVELVGLQERGDLGQGHVDRPKRLDAPSYRHLLRAVVPIPRSKIDHRGTKQAQTVVEAESLRRQAGDLGEATDREQIRHRILLEHNVKASPKGKVKRDVRCCSSQLCDHGTCYLGDREGAVRDAA
jgi:hypothetical protein